MENRENAGGPSTNGGQGNRMKDVQHMAEERLGELQERMGDLGERLSHFVRERPGAAIAIAVGAGFLVGRLLRS